jgi:hypothetical protein
MRTRSLCAHFEDLCPRMHGPHATFFNSPPTSSFGMVWPHLQAGLTRSELQKNCCLPSCQHTEHKSCRFQQRKFEQDGRKKQVRQIMSRYDISPKSVHLSKILGRRGQINAGEEPGTPRTYSFSQQPCAPGGFLKQDAKPIGYY